VSLDVAVDWDRPASGGDSEHWLSVSLRGVQNADKPRSLAILVDTSTSMVGDRLERARVAVAAAVQSCKAADRVLVLGFGSALTHLVEVSGGSDVAEALSSFVAAGKTRLDLALDEAERWLRDQSGRRHVLLLTDGDPTDADGRRVAGEPFVERARELGAEGVRITVVGLGSANGYDASLLRGIADAASGVACIGVGADKLVERTMAALRGGVAESTEIELRLDSPELSLLEAWRVEPRVQPIPLRGGALTAPFGSGGTVLLRCRLVVGLGSRRSERAVGNLVVAQCGGSSSSVPLTLNLVPPGSAERAVLNADVDRLRVKVELARTAQLRAAADEWDDQLRLTQQLADLADKLGDPRATRRVHADLSKLSGGEALGRDERETAVDALRGGTGDG